MKLSTDSQWRFAAGAVALPESTPAEALMPGKRVILHGPDLIECEAVVRRGDNGQWMADIVDGTTEYLPALEAAAKDPLPRVMTDFHDWDERGGYRLITRNVPPQAQIVGARVRLVAPHEFQYEAILRRDQWGWIGDVIEGTREDLPEPPEALRRHWGWID